MEKRNPIKIKEKNKGKFREYCGGKVTNECIEEGLASKSAKTRSRAQFALNSKSWNKD